MEILQFQYLNSQFSLEFFLNLYKQILETWKLDTNLKAVSGFINSNTLYFNENSLTDSVKESNVVYGILKSVNTIKEFKDIDKNFLKLEIIKEFLESIKSGNFIQEPEKLQKFLILSFADLKKFRFYYWVLNPVIIPFQKNLFYYKKHAMEIAENLKDVKEFSLIKKNGDQVEIENSLQNLEKYVKENIAFFIVVQSLNWSKRNFLYGLKVFFKDLKKIDFIVKDLLPEKCFLEVFTPGDVQEQDLDFEMVQSGGWEKNHLGKMGPKMVDLSNVLDTEKLASTAVDLNLKLIKWRAMPGLDLEKIARVKCCLFGAGTLGGYTARALMAWGVRNITFVDSGKVSYSNPVRQPLFRFKDCIDGGVDKAVAAAEELNAIFPGMNAKGHVLNIPMPGHPLKDSLETRALFQNIENIVEEHDAIFLLTDSRESRWLPTLLGAAKNKIVMNAALGFDSFLVMRHGSRAQEESVLGCYFCNDVVAPTDVIS
jgi:ubiquitin-like modifier-activating enzyme ATG7